MSNTPTPQDDARMDLLWDYLHGELAEDQVVAFEQMLRDNPELIGTGLDLIELTVMTRDVLQRGEAARQEAMLNSVADSSESGAMEALNELARMEAAAPVVLRSVDVPKKQKKQKDPNEPTPQDYINAGRYVLRMALISKPAKKLYTWSAIAAVLLLAFVLFNPFADSNDSNETPLTDNTAIESNDPNKPAESALPILRDQTVATLTAAHNATWAEGASAPGSLTPGSKLHPNQRLTLTAGIAEITTHDGAVAILEAPATIELLDNNNALHLHAGKLVGICETESSKGFVVRTPHMDITDLGTRFGVDANTLATEMHVFEGEVQAMHHPPEGVAAQEQRLTEGDAIRATSADQGFVAVDHDDTGFAALTTFAQSIVDRDAAEVGIAAMSGQLRGADAFTGHDPADWPTGDVAYIFEEHRNHALASEISTTVSTPGTYRNFSAAESATVPAGTVFRSYILILKPGSPDRPTRAQGQVTFEGEVLGVIANERDWRVFTNAVPGSFYPNLEEQILINGGADGDYITLEPDGRSLSFGYTVSSGAADTVRVIVREPADAPN